MTLVSRSSRENFLQKQPRRPLRAWHGLQAVSPGDPQPPGLLLRCPGKCILSLRPGRLGPPRPAWEPTQAVGLHACGGKSHLVLTVGAQGNLKPHMPPGLCPALTGSPHATLCPETPGALHGLPCPGAGAHHLCPPMPSPYSSSAPLSPQPSLPEEPPNAPRSTSFTPCPLPHCHDTPSMPSVLCILAPRPT